MRVEDFRKAYCTWGNGEMSKVDRIHQQRTSCLEVALDVFPTMVDMGIFMNASHQHHNI
jgi:hypothetical protein